MALIVAVQPRYSVDPQRVADTMAARLLDDYGPDEIHTLAREGVQKYARQHYTTLCAMFGMPSAATDDVVRLVWQRVADAQGVDAETGDPAFTFYD